LESGPAQVDRKHDIYPGLDTMRAVGALGVLVTHTTFWAGFYQSGLLGSMASRLDIGVAIFFVLSGFLLGRPFLAAMADDRRAPRAGRYLWKRFLRIMPLYIVTVTVALAALPDNRGVGWLAWLRTLTLTQIYPGGELVAGLTHMWSLCVEVGFYLALPLLMWLLRRTAGRRGWRIEAILIALAVAALGGWMWIALVSPRVEGSALWPPAYSAWFAAGIALAAITIELRRPGGREFTTFVGLAQQPGVCWSIAAALFAVAATPLAGPVLLLEPTATEAVTKNVLYVIIAVLILLPSILGHRNRSTYDNLLGARPLRHLGVISYGIFCLHLIVIQAVTVWLDLPLFQGHGWQLFGITVVGAVLLAELAYRVVERPAMRLRNIGSAPIPTTTPTASSTNH
jgi:peptidoglycan/LPS O-acetylase OafA/YrhL